MGQFDRTLESGCILWYISIIGTTADAESGRVFFPAVFRFPRRIALRRGGRRRFCRNVCSDAGSFSAEHADSFASAAGDRGGGRQGD